MPSDVELEAVPSDWVSLTKHRYVYSGDRVMQWISGMRLYTDSGSRSELPQLQGVRFGGLAEAQPSVPTGEESTLHTPCPFREQKTSALGAEALERLCASRQLKRSTGIKRRTCGFVPELS